MSRVTFTFIRRAVLIASTTFVAVYISSMIAVRAHEQATCCADPCSTSWPGGGCGCAAPCGISQHNHVWYYSGSCNPIEDMDNCVRSNCFVYDLVGDQCSAQCCADDMAECG